MSKSKTISIIVKSLLWAAFVVGATMFVSWETDLEKMGDDVRLSMVLFILIGFIFIYSLGNLKNYEERGTEHGNQD